MQSKAEKASGKGLAGARGVKERVKDKQKQALQTAQLSNFTLIFFFHF